jgi:hypothetical protein
MLHRGRRHQRRSESHQQKTRRWLPKKLIGRSTKSHVLLMGAQIKLKMEECASNMEHRSIDAAVTDAQVLLKREECALGMGQRRSNAAAKDAGTKLLEEECASSMVHR